ncbi:MAG: discoidin domain-containing protein [bacterium]
MKKLLMTVVLVLACTGSAPAAGSRQVISLDGIWQIAEGSLSTIPTTFDHDVPIPGLVDMATPAFEEVGVIDKKLREAFWYRRTFQVDEPIPAVAQLKVHKAMFGSKVILNGIDLGEHPASFTPSYVDVKPMLRQGKNEILIRVGVFPGKIETTIGWDYEKIKFIPGVFDSVELILTGVPHLDRVQAVPDIEKKSVTVHVWPAQPVQITVREASTHRVVGEMNGAEPLTIPIKDCRLWSPEDPFLYELIVRTTGDEITTRFGMRSFRLDPETGRAILNGKPYFMRGSNVTLYRFFEDPNRGALPWNADWVRTLHRRFKDMHWNSLRYCIGFPPEFWYRIADEEGLLIQDEFPIWNVNTKKAKRVTYDVDSLANQYRDWMQERWNHPCVIIWDACNETKSLDTGAALAKVRHLDFSNRPWDNGWSEPALPTDCKELHPYHFMAPKFTFPMLANETGTLNRKPGESPIIINEYGWLWLNRDGTPCSLTTDVYKNLLGKDSTTEQRRHLYARYLAAETEVWRCRRGVAGVLSFCGLGYSRPGGQTSDDWADVVKLTWEPEYYRYVRDSFAPIGLMIESWADEFTAGKSQDFPVIFINDLEKTWKGEVRFRFTRDGKTIVQDQRTVEIPGLGSDRLVFTVELPKDGGDCQIEATLLNTPYGSVSSLRDFSVLTSEQLAERAKKRNGSAVGKQVTASSNLVRDGATSPQAAVDGQLNTRWSSEFSDPQWLAIDLGSVTKINRVELVWEAHATGYAIQVSSDNQTWKDVYKTDQGKGGSETINFTPVEARWVRYYGTKRATKFGHSLFEFRVFK